MEQAGTEKTGKGTKKQRQRKDEVWKKVPPQAGGTLTKQIRNKNFHWCEHHMAWTVHKPLDCRLSRTTPATGPAAPTNTNPTPIAASAAAATFTAKSIMSLLGSSLGVTEDSDY